MQNSDKAQLFFAAHFDYFSAKLNETTQFSKNVLVYLSRKLLLKQAMHTELTKEKTHSGNSRFLDIAPENNFFFQI